MTALPWPAVKVLLPKKENDSIFVTPAHDSYHCMADGMWDIRGSVVEKGGQTVFSATKVSDMKYTLSRLPLVLRCFFGCYGAKGITCFA
jgi:hypothetical protein